MKTSKTKRALAFVLSAMMAVTAMPLTAFAATDSELASLKQAITAYETKMDGKVYTNMADAYSKYIYAKELVDAYSYGDDTSVNLASATSQLTAATAAMGTWTSNVAATNPAAADGSYTAAGLANGDTETGVLYTYGVSGNAPYTGSSTVNSSVMGLQFGNIVFLNDGTTPMTCPVNAYHKDSSWSTRRMRSMKSTTDGITMAKEWQSNSGSNGTKTVYQSGTSQAGWSSIVDNENAENGVAVDPSHTTCYYSSTIKYTGTLSDTTYSVTVNPTTWQARDNSDNILTVSHGGATIYVVNYKPIISALGAAANTNVLENIENYDEDATDMLAYLNALGTAQGVDPTTYDYASNQATAVASAASAIESAVSTITSTRNALNGSSTAYPDLRSAITLTRSTNKLGNGNNTYTDESWAEFDAAYQVAMNAIKNVDDNGYVTSFGGTAISTIASNLVTAYNNLETVKVLADVTDLTAAIINANKILERSSYLTTTSSNALSLALSDALTAYTNNDYTLPTVYDDSDQATVDALTLALNTAIAGVVLDTARLSNDLVTAKAIDQTTILDPAGLTRAINEGESAFDAATAAAEAITVDNIVSITTSYKEACEKLEAAITYANQPYVMQDSAVTSTGENKIASATYANGEDTIAYNYPTGIVIVQSEAVKKVYNIGTYSFAANNSKDSYSQKIYEIGITSGEVATRGSLRNGQFNLTGFNDLGAVVKDGDETVQGGLYCDSTTLVDYNTGITDGSDNTYLWYRNGGFSISSPMTFTSETKPMGTAPAIYSYTNESSYVKAYGAYSNWGKKTEDYNQLTATPIDVKVVDISALVSMLNLAPDAAANYDAYNPNKYVAINAAKDYKWYTQESYAKLTDAIAAAKLVSNKGAINTYASPEAYRDAAVSAYNAIKTAIAGLQVADYTVTFAYKTATGANTTKTLNGSYGTAIADNDIPAPETYVSGLNKFTFTGWDKAIETVDGGNAIISTITYTAQYQQSLNKADFTELDSAVASLCAKTDLVYSTADLQSIANFVDGLSYYHYDTDTRDATMGDQQAQIDAETATVVSKAATIAPDALTLDAAKAVIAMYGDQASKDSDAYDMREYTAIKLYSEVNVNGNVIQGLNYTDQNVLDAAISSALSSVLPMEYTVTIDGMLLGKFPYGTTLEVSSDGTTYSTDADLSQSLGGDVCAWYYSYNSNQVTKTTDPKYMLTSDTMGFIVKGNTFLTTEKTESSGTSYVVTFVTSFNNDRVMDVQYSDANGKVTMPNHNTYPFYTWSHWSNGVDDGEEITVSADTTITGVYTEETKAGYTITVDGTSDTLLDDTLEYNDVISCTDPDAYVWVKSLGDTYVKLTNFINVEDKAEGNYTADQLSYIDGTQEAYDQYGVAPRDGYQIVAFGDTLTCNACEDAYYMALDEDTFNNYIAFSLPYVSVYDEGLGEDTTYDTKSGNIKNSATQVQTRRYYKWSEYKYAFINQDDNQVVSSIKSGILKVEGKFSMISEFAVPQDASMVEVGVLFTTAADKTLTIANATTDTSIKRLKSSKHTGTSNKYGQYVISIKTASIAGKTLDLSYRSYCIYNLNGNTYTAYSDNTVKETATF